MLKRLFIVMAAMLAGLLPMLAQTVQAESAENVEPDLNVVQQIVESSNGNIIIEIDPDVLEMILRKPEKPAQNQPSGPGRHKMKGYRVQVFGDGRNPHSLESRARARGNAVAQRFPKYRGQVYTFSKSPNWYTTVGNFRSREEADEAMAELKRAFGAFASEMRVTRSDIIIVNP